MMFGMLIKSAIEQLLVDRENKEEINKIHNRIKVLDEHWQTLTQAWNALEAFCSLKAHKDPFDRGSMDMSTQRKRRSLFQQNIIFLSVKKS